MILGFDIDSSRGVASFPVREKALYVAPYDLEGFTVLSKNRSFGSGSGPRRNKQPCCSWVGSLTNFQERIS